VAQATAGEIAFYVIPATLAMLGGISVYAPGHLFPLASQVLGLLQSFKILPTVLLTLIKPRGHIFKVTPKGRGARQSGYAGGIFWSVAAMIALTLGGLVINALPEWRQATVATLPIVSLWAVNNIVVLFLACMMTLQAPARRDEERFEFDEPIWIFSAAGALSSGRIRDMSLTGVAIRPDHERALGTQAGERIRLFISEVGFVPGQIVRQSGDFVAVRFELAESVERDLLIRKLFTSGYDTAGVSVSTWSATIAMLKSIWLTRAELPEQSLSAAPASSTTFVQAAIMTENLQSESLIVRPRAPQQSIAKLVEERRAIAA
jgi:cellulose synthase (UDP-forming)